MITYADIIVDISIDKIDRAFQYRVPERLEGRIDVGSCVTVPFGRGNRIIKGYVVAVTDKCNYDALKIKDICDVAVNCVGTEDRMVRLAAFIKKSFGGTMIQALKTVLPARKSVKKIEHKHIKRLMDKEETISFLGECERKHQTAKARLLRELVTQEVIPYEWVTGKLGVSAQAVKSLEEKGAISVLHSFSYRNPVHSSAVRTTDGEKKQLSAKQQYIVDEYRDNLLKGINENFLIHGITGSGKTEVYIQLIEENLKIGRQAIMLIPEIALTYQTLLRFYKRFGDRVSVMNSTLSPGEKFDQCERAKNGEIDIIIGPRSALFIPFKNLGLIIIDEEHENSYKSESTPKYHAREAAYELARLSGADVVLGSATPSVESFYNAKNGRLRLFTLNERLTGGELPVVYTVDLREELKSGNRSIFSRKLKNLLEDRLEKGQQSMLFLNRRGYAGFVSCRACGEVMKCPNCDVSLSEHSGKKMLCHYCGYETDKPSLCPVCGSKYILGFKAGTQQIEEKLKELFPNVRTLRMDGDTTKTKESYERILSSFSNGEADVLIGTQMIVKGHDFPNVTLVGVLAADLSLGANDYRSSERTFELLTQAVGRAGRGSIPGEAVIQTYQPKHYAVVHAANQDYSGFYEEEILYRELAGYPPVRHLLAVQIYGKDEQNTKTLAKRLAGMVKCDREIKVMGPAPASISKINNVYRYVFYLKGADYGALVKIKDELEDAVLKLQLRYESVQFDFDPVNMI